MAYERGLFEQQISKLAGEQLSEWNAAIADTAGTMALSVEDAAWEIEDHDALRERIRKDGRIRQFFVLGADGQFLYPPIQQTMTHGEREFIERTRSVWESGAIAQRNSKVPLDSKTNVLLSSGAAGGLRGQWHPWYWGSGLQLLYWWPTGSGEIYGVEWDRSRLIADVIGILPDTSLRAEEESLGVQWVGATGQVLYQWGIHPEKGDEGPIAEQALTNPFGAWAFKAYSGVSGSWQLGRLWYLATILSAAVLIFVSLGVYFYRENSRELREASQRISFVNHVSHELKTPLTNIRLYAELLREHANAPSEQDSKRLSVILSESERLSRLINNVLAFNRNRSSKLRLNAARGSVDDTLRQVLDQFRPLLAQHNVDLHFTGSAQEDCGFDRDVLEQIVGNLLSNVEKYARDASVVMVESGMNGGAIGILVYDNGNGIPEREREAIFEPFYRIDNASNEGIAGTGIGLSIARDLARLHGGELTLEASEVGARFRVRLQVQIGGFA
jgi:signal transduction histidine kinase